MNRAQPSAFQDDSVQAFKVPAVQGKELHLARLATKTEGAYSLIAVHDPLTIEENRAKNLAHV